MMRSVLDVTQYLIAIVLIGVIVVLAALVVTDIVWAIKHRTPEKLGWTVGVVFIIALLVPLMALTIENALTQH